MRFTRHEVPHSAVTSSTLLTASSQAQIFASAPHSDNSLTNVLPLMGETQFHAHKKHRAKFKIRYIFICPYHWPRSMSRPPAEGNFKSRRRHGCFACCECCVLSGRGLCVGLITRPEESYRLCCVVVCDLEISRLRRAWPTFFVFATNHSPTLHNERHRKHDSDNRK